MLSPVKIWRNQKKIAGLAGKTGRIISWTIVRVPPNGFADQAPYPVAVVELDGGKRIMAQLVDWEDRHVAFGQKVVTTIRRITQPNTEGVIPYGIKVKPI
ncbi:OB-fold domain-containing protein [Patescibacteria group bacterium]|nr:OB-fold domain-containing protein [Patescibacteria group bacterium]MBU1472198.1 OB-fold domain-containing protein [Patescibacteria group bacterium]MBU2459592.1 OB-fold domain-containing protein [Patescibacteria group bacterium]MBU2544167.1 OB-fold domain-containing protein [Patescibacteria group bacterium]